MRTIHTKNRAKNHIKDTQKSVFEAVRLGRGFDQVSDHVVMTDGRGYILYANKAVEASTGYTIKEVIGKRPGDLWGGAMAVEFYKKMWHTIAVEKKPFIGEVQNKRKDDVLFWQELHISPILNQNGEVQFFIAIEPNITKKKEKEKLREEFTAIVSHQLRNPIQTIALLTEILMESETMTGEEKEEVQLISEENKGLSDFVGDLLVLSRTGKEKLSQEPLDIGNEIEKIICDVRVMYPHVAISFAKKGNNFSHVTNRSLAFQVFSNLIYNAVEYSDGEVHIDLEGTGIVYVFSCHNNGLEISQEHGPRIFTKLFRAESARQRKETGSGLGLYIVKTITDMFGWTVWFESAAGRGTTFFVKIPLRR